jgi:hypothetical protein
MSSETWPHLNLRAWPFSVVPPARPTDLWLGRPEAEQRMRRILRSARSVPTSQILLLWADYGAGKTHALRHMEYLARSVDGLVPLYVATPKGIKSFLDVYHAIIDAAYKSGILATIGRELFNATMNREVQADVDRAIVRIPTYDERTAKIALSWLAGDRVSAADLRDIGISRRLESTSDAVDALNRVIGLIRGSGKRSLVLFLDEVQELTDLKKRLPEAVGGLHKVFDRNTEGLTMIFSFTLGNQDTVRTIIGDALFDRASIGVRLPELEFDEAAALVSGLIETCSIDRKRVPFPFDDDAIIEVVRLVHTSTTILTPRDVLEASNAVLREADFDISEGAVKSIDTAYVKRCLADTKHSPNAGGAEHVRG